MENLPPKFPMESTDIHENIRQTIAMITDLDIPTQNMIPYLRTLFEYHLYRTGKYGVLDKCLQFMHDHVNKLARESELHTCSSRARLGQRLALDALLVAHIGHGDSAFVVLLKFAGRETTDNLTDWNMFELTRMRKKIARAGVQAAEERLKAVVALRGEKIEYSEPGLWVVELVKAKVEDQMVNYRVLEADKRLRLRVFGPGSKPWSQEAWKHALDMAERGLDIHNSSNEPSHLHPPYYFKQKYPHSAPPVMIFSDTNLVIYLMAALATFLTVVTVANPTALAATTTIKPGARSRATNKDTLSSSVPFIFLAILILLLVLAVFILLECSCIKKLRSPTPSLPSPLSDRWPTDGPETDWERGQRLAGERDSRIRFIAEMFDGNFSFSEADDSDPENLGSPSRFGVGGGGGGGGGESFELQDLSGGHASISAPQNSMVRVGPGTPGDRFVPMTVLWDMRDHTDEGGPSR
ncbi:hypothetical protein B9Z19DRAFT_1121298 [Tuber borchii]|uniref:Uncharacterized protein n=1 Tax=Tuber borchii TaxID=42251 RepID=A0A2T7A2X1_TUBBO|nr:hypothetical protein B9Z19DRAFT_1121298 [Tuber borchii]